MTKHKPISIREFLMGEFKKNFSSLGIWKKLEPEIALRCANLPEPISNEDQKEFVEKLELVKQMLLEKGIKEEELKFIDEEIRRNEDTKTISLFEEDEDEIDNATITNYSRMGKGTEGVVGIHHKFNYSQLSRLTNGVYKETGLVKFYISQEKKIYGKIVAEIYEHSQKIPIATVVESDKVNKETDEFDRKVILFGRKTPKEYKVIKEISIPFYVYRFITETNEEVILMSPEQCEIGDHIITGVTTHCLDHKMLTDSAKLPTKLPFFFSQETRSNIVKYKSSKSFTRRIKKLGITKENFFDFPFTIEKNLKDWRTLHPTWYKWLIWAWLTHQNKGLFNNYPLHLMIIGPKHSGKSLLLNVLHAKSRETRNVFSGSSSTMKHLIPSFKYNPARLGYLAESNRFAFCDEFLRCIIRSHTSKDGSQREEGVALMNDLLEHQKREAGSGVSRVNINMTARIIATTNPLKGIKNVSDLINKFDESFLSRSLLYYQTDEHVQMIRRSSDSDLGEYKYGIGNFEWVGLLDYLHSFSANYDIKKVKEIHSSVPHVLNETLNKHYDARHLHHIECLIDGIIKTRCFLENDMSFNAKEEDYKILKEVWSHVIKSWLNPESIKNIDIKERINYLPENCQYIFNEICNLKRPAGREEVKEIAFKGMDELGFYEAWTILSNMDLIIEADGNTRPYYMSEVKDGSP